MVRGVGFEPTKAFATGFLLCRILSQAPSDKRRPCPFDLSPAHRAFALGLGNPRRSKFGVSAFLKPLKSLGNCSPVSRHPLTKTRGTTRTTSPTPPYAGNQLATVNPQATSLAIIPNHASSS